jgi:methylated-DNA-[protein]-cysteine S-methyltransferase
MTALPDRVLDALAADAVREGLADALYAPVDTPIGRLTVATGAGGVVRVAFPEEPEDAVLAGVAAGLGPRVLRAPRELRETGEALQAWLEGARDGDLELPVDLSLVTAPFRRRVLETLHAEVHRGSTIRYGELAARAGSPGASRAVGSAMATNPIPVLVPCHRVLPATGRVGNYAGGVQRKVALLALEHSLPSAAG